ncbi:MAG TPA: ADOP family duplicated permease [Bryobacteraceae bacterium]|nr:ADOP family duplicated permease [Bryobacteraceae bacterium]
MGRFFRKLLRRGAMHQSIEDELAFHREMAARHGNPIPLGNTAVIAEHGYALRRFSFLENLWRDVVYAARGLRRSPMLVAAALVSLGLGIGVNATMFSLGVEFLFSEPSVHDAASVLSVRFSGNSHSPHQVLDFLASSGLFADVVGENEEVFSNYNDGAETRPVFGVFTTKNYFTALGVPMLHGRGIAPDDPDEVAVLSYQFWQKYLRGDAAVVGRSLNLDGRMCTVVGILPEHHRTLIGFGYTPDIYMPRYLESTILAIYARRKPDMSVPAARAALAAVAKRLDIAIPVPYKYEQNLEVSPIAGWARLKFESDTLTLAVFFALLLLVTGLVLLIACVNVASLLLARASARRREIAIRIAIGASRGRLLQQLLADSFLLSLLGAAAGLALAEFSAMMLARIHLPLPMPISLQITPDWRLALYGAFLATASMLACGLLPAWQALKESISRDLHRENRMRLRRVLVAAQVAISVVVLATGFLFLRNLLRATALSPGFDVIHTIRANVNLPPSGYTESRQKYAFDEQVLSSLTALPGIESAAAARVVPFNGGTHFMVDLVFPDNGQHQRARFDWNAVTPGYFQTMGIPLLQGRTFTAEDRGRQVVVVNSAFVARYLGGRQPLGTVFLWGHDGKTPYRIVGLAAVTKIMTIGEAPQPQLYEPLAQIDNDRREIEFVMRSAIPPGLQLQPVARVLHRIEPMAGAEVHTMYSSIGLAFLPSQVGALLMGSTGVLGLLLATIGLYGVMAFSVARRTREIGVRMACGASRGDIARLVLRDSARVTLAGTVIGLLLALFVTRPLAMFLVPGLKPADPVNYAVAALAITVVALAATCGPILRALRIDPNSALRDE